MNSPHTRFGKKKNLQEKARVLETQAKALETQVESERTERIKVQETATQLAQGVGARVTLIGNPVRADIRALGRPVVAFSEHMAATDRTVKALTRRIGA